MPVAPGLILEVHIASHSASRYRGNPAELSTGMKIPCSSRQDTVLKLKRGMYRLPVPTRVKRAKGSAPADDLVNREFDRESMNER